MNPQQPWVLDISIKHQAGELARDAAQYHLASEASQASGANWAQAAVAFIARLAQVLAALRHSLGVDRRAA